MLGVLVILTNKNTNDANRLCKGIHEIVSSRSRETDQIMDDLLLFLGR
jgi:hypothetical protein